MDRRNFLRITSLVVRPALPGNRVFSMLFAGVQNTTGEVLSSFQVHEGTMLKIIGLHEKYSGQMYEDKRLSLLGILQEIGDKVHSLVQETSLPTLLNAIPYVDKYIGTQILCTHFTRMTKEQRMEIIKSLFLLKKGFDKQDLGDYFLMDNYGYYTEQHTTFRYPEGYLAEWFHNLPASTVTDFIEALPSELSGLDEWSCHNFFDSIFASQYFTSGFSAGIEKLSILFDRVDNHQWKKLFLDRMVDAIEGGDIDMGLLETCSSSELLSRTFGVAQRLQAEGILGGCEDGVFYSSTRNEAIAKVMGITEVEGIVASSANILDITGGLIIGASPEPKQDTTKRNFQNLDIALPEKPSILYTTLPESSN